MGKDEPAEEKYSQATFSKSGWNMNVKNKLLTDAGWSSNQCCFELIIMVVWGIGVDVCLREMHIIGYGKSKGGDNRFMLPSKT